MAQSNSTTDTTPSSTSSSSPARLSDDNSNGKTTIASSVVQKIAGMAAKEISGVHALGGGVSRAVGALRERIPGGGTTVSTSGVAVEVGEKQTAIDLDVVVEYGAGIVELAAAVRRNVITAVERMTGLDVIEVNIAVNDIHLPEDDEGEDTQTRVE
ncbi:MAG: Asp23/Gls24 family envelope stress response protein [Sciscionella sp.]